MHRYTLCWWTIFKGFIDAMAIGDNEATLGNGKFAWSDLGSTAPSRLDRPLEMHGGMLVLHEWWLARICSTQHLLAPPGLRSHPSPPHFPQEAGQQMSRSAPGPRIPPGQVGIKHGGEPLAHEWPLEWIWAMQHAEAPPGLVSQPGPPHLPQDFAQQMSVSEPSPGIPKRHLTSAAKPEVTPSRKADTQA